MKSLADGLQVIGGGTSGLTVAKRLAEDPSISVAVVEAGGPYRVANGNLSQIPAFCTHYSADVVTDVPPRID